MEENLHSRTEKRGKGHIKLFSLVRKKKKTKKTEKFGFLEEEVFQPS